MRRQKARVVALLIRVAFVAEIVVDADAGGVISARRCLLERLEERLFLHRRDHRDALRRIRRQEFLRPDQGELLAPLIPLRGLKRFGQPLIEIRGDLGGLCAARFLVGGDDDFGQLIH